MLSDDAYVPLNPGIYEGQMMFYEPRISYRGTGYFAFQYRLDNGRTIWSYHIPRSYMEIGLVEKRAYKAINEKRPCTVVVQHNRKGEVNRYNVEVTIN